MFNTYDHCDPDLEVYQFALRYKRFHFFIYIWNASKTVTSAVCVSFKHWDYDLQAGVHNL